VNQSSTSVPTGAAARPILAGPAHSDGVPATSTSSPASANARASGTRGWKCPTAGALTTITRTWPSRHEAAAFQPGPQGGVEGGGQPVVEGEVVRGEGVVPPAVASLVEEGVRAAGELVHRAEEPGGVAFHRPEPGGVDQGGPRLLGHRVIDVGRDAAHLAVEVGLQVVVVNQQDVLQVADAHHAAAWWWCDQNGQPSASQSNDARVSHCDHSQWRSSGQRGNGSPGGSPAAVASYIVSL